jgi:hypothetical protein
MEDLNNIQVSDIVYLVEDDSILKMQVIRTTNKQIVIENHHKFWKSSGDKVGDISANKSKIYNICHPVVTELYKKHINLYTVIEWLYQLKILILTKENVNIEDLKFKFEELYELIIKYK